MGGAGTERGIVRARKGARRRRGGGYWSECHGDFNLCACSASRLHSFARDLGKHDADSLESPQILFAHHVRETLLPLIPLPRLFSKPPACHPRPLRVLLLPLPTTSRRHFRSLRLHPTLPSLRLYKRSWDRRPRLQAPWLRLGNPT